MKLYHRPTRLLSDVLTLRERIEHTLHNGRNHNGLRRKLYLELLGVLNGSGTFQQIPENVPNIHGLTRRIARRLGAEMDFALPRAVYESSHYGITPESVIQRLDIHRAEWDYLSHLAREFDVPVQHGQEAVVEPPPWMIDVDEAHQVLRVWIRELALQDMLLAAMESYLVPAGSGMPSTEIYGIVFGSMRSQPRSRVRTGRMALEDVNVERVCIQHRARGRPSEVTVDVRSEVTQLAMGEELFPFWHLLGDFHTHTYRSLSELSQQGGWRYSNVDQEMNVEWCARLRRIGHRPRIALILAIARAGRRGAGAVENWNGLPNVLKTTIGRCHCFLSAYRIRPDGRYSSEALTLRCPHLAGH
ncbi:MAG: hypothetical protein AB7Q17_03670 [Phycisphaerae bacterium]